MFFIELIFIEKPEDKQNTISDDEDPGDDSPDENEDN